MRCLAGSYYSGIGLLRHIEAVDWAKSIRWPRPVTWASALLQTDQPGRIVAVFIVSPILASKAVAYGDAFIGSFSLALFAWDLYWLVRAAPRSIRTS